MWVRGIATELGTWDCECGYAKLAQMAGHSWTKLEADEWQKGVKSCKKEIPQETLADRVEVKTEVTVAVPTSSGLAPPPLLAAADARATWTTRRQQPATRRLPNKQENLTAHLARLTADDAANDELHGAQLEAHLLDRHLEIDNLLATMRGFPPP